MEDNIEGFTEVTGQIFSVLYEYFTEHTSINYLSLSGYTEPCGKASARLLRFNVRGQGKSSMYEAVNGYFSVLSGKTSVISFEKSERLKRSA